jgi:hypothetical protein
MQATGTPVHLSVLLCWAAPLAALAWTLAAYRISGARTAPAIRTLLPAGLAGAVIAALTAAACQWAIGKGAAIGPPGPVWTQVAIGAFACLVGVVAAGLILQKDAGAGTDAWRATDAAMTALIIPAMLGAYLLGKHTARPLEWLAVAPLGAAITAASVVMALRGLGEGDACKRAQEILEALAAGCATVSFGILLGKMHYAGHFERAGDVTALFLAACLGIWLALSLSQRLAFPGSRAISALWGLAYTGFALWFAWLLTKAVHADSQAAYCLWAGLGAGATIVLLYISGAMEPSSPQVRTSSLVSAAAILAAAALSLRFQTGFGLALCAAGLMGALGLWSLLTPWMGRASGQAFPAWFAWGAGYLAAWCALRIWLEWHGGASIPASSPYVFLGLSIGLALPFVLTSLAGGQEEAPSRAGAMLGAVMLPVALGATVLLVSTVLREPSVRLFLLGCGAAGMAAPFVLAAAPAVRSLAPAVSGGLAAVCLTLVTAGALQQWSEEATRAGKVRVLVLVTVILAAGYVMMEGRRLPAVRRRISSG